ncbi:hypothetical protein TGVAND_436690, partial [Toxoplasma gondii VAND]
DYWLASQRSTRDACTFGDIGVSVGLLQESRRSSRKGQAAAGREDASKGPQTETGSVNPEEGPSGQQKVRCRVGWHCRRVSWPTRCRHLLCRKEQ